MLDLRKGENIMFDTRAAQTQEGFKPNVDNNIREAKISTGEMALVVL